MVKLEKNGGRGCLTTSGPPPPQINLRGLGMWPHCDLVLSWTISIVLAPKKISYSSIKITLDSSVCGEYTWGWVASGIRNVG